MKWIGCMRLYGHKFSLFRGHLVLACVLGHGHDGKCEKKWRRADDEEISAFTNATVG